MLGATAWQDDFSTMLKLCSEGANVAYILGDIGEMKVLIDLVLSWGNIPLHAKFRLYEVKILALRSTNEFEESIKLCTNIRQQLGLYTPPNKPASKYQLLKEYSKTLRALKNKSANDIASLPVLTDERIIFGNRILELMSLSAEVAQPSIVPLISFILIQTSLKNGINASSCYAFASFGLVQW